MKLSFLIMTLLVCCVSVPTLQATLDNSQTETSNTLCVVDVNGLPVPVRFQNSLTLTQAIKKAGIAREGIKSRVRIFRRLQTGALQLTKLDLKRIEKEGTDFILDQYDIVFVEPKNKYSPAELEAIWRSCEICGCKLIPLMHGGYVPVPKEWSASNAPAEKNPDPNNQKP